MIMMKMLTMKTMIMIIGPISYSTSGLSLGLQASDQLGCCEIGLHSCKMMKMPKEEYRIDPQQFMAMYDRRWQGCTRSKSNKEFKNIAKIAKLPYFNFEL